MPGSKLEDVLRGVERGRLSSVFAAGASLYQSVRRRRLHVFYVDREGDWINWQRSASFVSPIPHRMDARTVEMLVRDQWMHRYRAREGDVIIDVGAGIGEDALVFSRLVGATGRVVAIEAHPRTFACLAKVVGRNHLSNVTPLHCAVTDIEQDVLISDEGDDLHLVNSIIGGRGKGGMTVRGRTLDSIVSELGLERIDLLKMNIEGAEKPALVGMKETLKRTRFAAISCHDFLADSGGSSETRTRADVHAALERAGFVVERRAEDERPWVRDYLYATRQ